MKKISIVLAPLIALSFLTNCKEQVVEHFVSFESSGGSHIETQRIKSGDIALKPDNPTRDYHEFKGWFTDNETFQNEYTFTEPVNNDITLYARWDGNPPKITHHFKFTGHDCFVEKSSEYETDILANESDSFQITSSDGFSLPTIDADHFKVKQGEDIVSYDGYDGIITISAMTTDVEIEAFAVKEDIYTFSFSGVNCKIYGSETYTESVKRGEYRQYTILPNPGYILPTSITLPDFATYKDGNIIINGMLEDIKLENIVAPLKEIKYSINFNGENCKAKDENMEAYARSFQTTRSNLVTDDLILTLAPDDDKYVLPTSIEILFDNVPGTQPHDYSYDIASRTITIKKMGNVSINVKAFIPKSTCTIDLDACKGGTFFTGKQELIFEVAPGSKLSSILKNVNIPTITGNLFGYYRYNDGTSVNYNDVVNTDITLKAHYFNITAPLTNLDIITWDVIKEVAITNKNPEVCFKLGATKTLKVNGRDHKTRIIDFNRDVDANGNSLGFTFEFANLISDRENGYSLATQWNDTWDLTTSNHDYLNSSMRKALIGEGGGHILWAQYNATTWSTSYTSPVLSMIEEENPDFVNKIISAPQKIVPCYKNEVWSDKTIYDKLFLLSPKEIEYVKYQNSAYAYYNIGGSSRIKKQVTGNIVITSYTRIQDHAGGQEALGSVECMAGYNSATNSSGGGYYWLRSPDIENNVDAFAITDVGSSFSGSVTYGAVAVAPAFCI